MQTVNQRVLSSELFWSGLTFLLMLGSAAVVAAALLRFPAPLVGVSIVAILVGVVILVQPLVGILLFLGQVYTRVDQVFPVIATTRLPMLLCCFTIFAWIIQVILKRETVKWRIESSWVVLFCGTIVLSTMQVPSTGEVLDTAMDIGKLAIMFVLLSQLMNSPRRLNLGMQCLLGFTVLLSISATWGWLQGQGMMDQGTARAIVRVGLLDDPNDLAAALVLPIPIALYECLRGKTAVARLWGASCLGILLVGIYVCNSRGGMLALGVALGVFLVYQLGWTRGLMLGAAGLGLMLVFGPDRFAPETLSGSDDSAVGRLQAWAAGLRMVAEHPVLGVGRHQFSEYHAITAHNSFVLALGEGGLLNAFCWVGMNYWAVLTLVRVRQTQRNVQGGELWVARATVLQAGLLASLTAGMFLSQAYWQIPMIPLAFAAAMGGLGLDGKRPRSADWLHVGMVPLVLAAGILVIRLVTKIAG
jgi:putative inorganic carbon (hco3(-)) transporter